jgi:hypothetical protein
VNFKLIIGFSSIIESLNKVGFELDSLIQIFDLFLIFNKQVVSSSPFMIDFLCNLRSCSYEDGRTSSALLIVWRVCLLHERHKAVHVHVTGK